MWVPIVAVTNKGIILAGGTGSRLSPITNVVNKHLLPIYDKPLIYYPLSTLMVAGISEILIVSSPNELNSFESLLGNGGNFGIHISYAVQAQPLGLSDALKHSAFFTGGDPFALILGDNIFFSSGLSGLLFDMFQVSSEASCAILTANVRDPQRFGVLELGADGNARRIVEKPETPATNTVVTGIYKFPGDAIDRANSLEPSDRGELEITDLINAYLDAESSLEVFEMPRGGVWFDAGTIESMCEATDFIKAYQQASGRYIGCPEEVALLKGLVTHQFLGESLEDKKLTSDYWRYVADLVND